MGKLHAPDWYTNKHTTVSHKTQLLFRSDNRSAKTDSSTVETREFRVYLPTKNKLCALGVQGGCLLSSRSSFCSSASSSSLFLLFTSHSSYLLLLFFFFFFLFNFTFFSFIFFLAFVIFVI